MGAGGSAAAMLQQQESHNPALLQGCGLLPAAKMLSTATTVLQSCWVLSSRVI
jgi:hypothetical protein